MPAASRLRRRGQAWVEHLACPRPATAVPPVSIRPAVSGWAGDGAGRFAVVRVAAPGRGGSVIFGPMTGRRAWLCGLAHALMGHRGTRAARASEGRLHNKMTLLLALVRRNYIRKSSINSRDGRI
jgi:hypothetical protein